MKKYSTLLLMSLVLAWFFSKPVQGQIMINEYSVSNISTIVDNYNEHEDWFELFNMGLSTVDLGGYYLSDNPADSAKWEIPAGVTIQPNGFLLFWASGRDEVTANGRHTNFRLSQTKENPEYIVLTDPSGAILQNIQLQLTHKGHSRGRYPNGSDNWKIFTTPTAGNTNQTSTYNAYAQKPVVSDTAGFYTEQLIVLITTAELDAVIRYTLDGTEPTTSSTLYSTPLFISTTTILKARTFSNDPLVLPSLIEFNTYFMNEHFNLPVLSLGANQLTTLLNGNAGLRPFGSAELFDTNGVRIETAYGEFNEHGQDSWVHPQRSIDYITRDECGYNYALRHEFFSLSDRDEFQRLILRASGDDNYPGIDTSAHVRDDFVQTLSQMAGQRLDWRKSERFIMFANGQLWGIYAFREKVHDHDYTDYYYNQGKFDIQFIMTWGSTWAEYGGQQALNDWESLYNYIITHDMTDPGNFHMVDSLYDYRSLVDYVHINSLVVCSDWLNWNVGWWRGLDPAGTHRKWAYILWDEDATFGHYINYTGVPGQNPYVSPCFPQNLTSAWQDPEGHITVLNKLRTNDEFNQYYVSRYIDLLNTAFKDEYMIHVFDSMAALIEPDMPQHVQRWGGSVAEWQNNVQKVRNFILTRYGIMHEGIANCWNLEGPFDLDLNVVTNGKGRIRINSITPGEYPWTGKYFGNIDIKLNAECTDPGWEFDRWVTTNHEVFPNDTTENVTLSLTQGDSIVALFIPKTFSDSLVINEINYNSANDFDPGDWVEFYNPHDYQLDISNWKFKDEDDLHVFHFPLGTVIEPEGYTVVCADTAAFHSLFPDVLNYMGPAGFGLNGNGKLLRLYNVQDILIDTVHYADSLPWPPEPDGNGPTLMLIDPAYDNALPESWTASLEHGTPGAENILIDIPEVKPSDLNLKVDVFPNPVDGSATFRINVKPEDGELVIMNANGKEMQRFENIRATQVLFNGFGYQPGIYFFKYTDRKRNLLTAGKFVIR